MKAVGSVDSSAATPATAIHIDTWSPAMTPSVAPVPPDTPPFWSR